MNKFLQAVAVSSALALSAAPALAKDACATIVCLGGSMIGGKGGMMCKEPIQDYFDIKKTKHGDFSPSRTLKARKDYLDDCESEKEGNKARIHAKYGMVPSNPGFQ